MTREQIYKAVNSCDYAIFKTVYGNEVGVNCRFYRKRIYEKFKNSKERTAYQSYRECSFHEMIKSRTAGYIYYTYKLQLEYSKK